MNKSFTMAKQEFDNKYGTEKEFDVFLSEHLTLNKKVNLKKKNGSNNEQYYKWQFFYALINSGLYIKDYIGTEINFPKGNKNAANIKLDGAIFDDSSWFEYYSKYHNSNDMEALNWLRKHLVAAIEFKKEENKDIATIWEK